MPLENHASVTLGVVPNQIGTVAMAVYTAGVLKATSVKVGFMNTEYDAAAETLLAAREALEGFDTKLIGSLFADNPLYGGLDAHHMVQAGSGRAVRRLPRRHADQGRKEPVRLPSRRTS